MCDTRIETHARFGSPAEVLCDIAAHLQADLIVVGNKGMQGGRRFLGSVPNTVSHHAPCSVLIVDTLSDSDDELAGVTVAEPTVTPEAAPPRTRARPARCGSATRSRRSSSLAIAAGVYLVCVVPHFAGIDEPAHFYRSYQISTGTIFPEKEGSRELRRRVHPARRHPRAARRLAACSPSTT